MKGMKKPLRIAQKVKGFCDMMSDDKIVCLEFDTAHLEALFDESQEEDSRKNAEMKVVEFVNGMKYVVDDKEKEVER